MENSQNLPLLGGEFFMDLRDELGLSPSCQDLFMLCLRGSGDVGVEGTRDLIRRGENCDEFWREPFTAVKAEVA